MNVTISYVLRHIYVTYVLPLQIDALFATDLCGVISCVMFRVTTTLIRILLDRF